MSWKRLAIILVVLAVLATGVFTVVMFLREEQLLGRPLARANLKALEVRALDPLDRPDSQARAGEQATKIIARLNAYYVTAFLRPERWTPDPDEPAAERVEDQIANFFTGEARPALQPNLPALALSDLAHDLKRVDPVKQEARVSIEFEEDGTTPFAIVTTTFDADAEPKEEAQDGRARTIKIVQNATFWMVAVGDVYEIFAYRAELKADEVVESAAFAPSEWPSGRAA